MDQERKFALWGNYMAGEATPEEIEEFEWAFQSDPDLRRMAQLLHALRQRPPKGISGEEEHQMLQRGLQRFANPPIRSLPVIKLISAEATTAAPNGAIISRGAGAEGRTRVRLFPRMAAAAVLFVMITGGIFYSRIEKRSSAISKVPTVIAAARGVKKLMQLADGSKLWLNAGSRIVFSPGFDAGTREMTLEGEAFFEVKHDQLNPFIIHSGRLDVRVLGTALNVRAYPGDSMMEATLINGKIEIDVRGNIQSSIILHPNEKVTVPMGRAAFSAARPDSALTGPAGIAPSVNTPGVNTPVKFFRRSVEPDRTDGSISETSWVSNKLVFRQETLAGMATRLERWYDVKIIFSNERFRNDTLSGTFPEEPIGDVMHALQITAGFRYRIDKDTVRIW